MDKSAKQIYRTHTNESVLFRRVLKSLQFSSGARKPKLEQKDSNKVFTKRRWKTSTWQNSGTVEEKKPFYNHVLRMRNHKRCLEGKS